MSYQIRVLPFEETLECEAGETILEAALRQGRFLRYGCKNGGCGTCRAVLVDGDVDEPASLLALRNEERDAGWVLLCSSRPVEDCAIDVSAMELRVDEFAAGDNTAEFSAEVIANRRIARDIRALRLRLLEPDQMKFVAGQFVNVEVPGTDQTRSYSMANPPLDADHIELIVKILPGGAFSRACEQALAPGDRLRLLGPLGQLRVRLSYRSILMIAGGSGMAPLLSMLGHLADAASERPVHFFFGARTVEDLYFLDRIDELRARLPTLEFVPALSEVWPEDWSGETGLVTDVVMRRFDSLRGFDAYLCGPPPMIDAAIPQLIERGVRPQNVYFDAFLPTGSR